MGLGELLLVIGASVLTSYVTTKYVTIRYFEVIDGYVNGLFEDTKKHLANAAFKEKTSERS